MAAIVELLSIPDHLRPINIEQWSNDRRFNSYNQFWVDRRGNVYEVDGHWYFADEHFRMSVSELENHGWLHVSYGKIYCFKRYLTHKQKDFIDLYACELGKTEDDIISDISRYADEHKPGRTEYVHNLLTKHEVFA